MNNKLVSMLLAPLVPLGLGLALFFVLALSNSAAIAQETAKEKSCAGGCCLPAVGTQAGGEKSITMANMQDHDMHKHEQHKKDTTAMNDAETHDQHKPEQSKKETDVKKESEKTAVEYTCPMHPEVKSSKPGKCPKCGMELVQAKKETTSLMKKKMRLMMEGKYNCCIEEPCDECLKAHGECNCKNAVKNNKPVCDECYQAWKEGKGDVSGKTFKDIKSGHKH